MNAKLKATVALPLASLWLTWGLFAAGVALSPQNYSPIADFTTYWFLGGIAILAVGSAVAFRLADFEVSSRPTRASRSVLSFASFSLIMASVAGGIYAFTVFTSVFGMAAQDKFLHGYLPIILVALIVVGAILQATVLRKSAAEAEVGGKRDPRKVALGLAWSVPLLGSALALVIAAIVAGSKVEITAWLWVFLLTLVGASVTVGTHFASKARGFGVRQVRQREEESGTGAGRLNYVFTVVVGAVASTTGFFMALNAVGNLTHHDEFTDYEGPQKIVTDSLIPGVLFLLLGTALVYITFILRHRKDS